MLTNLFSLKNQGLIGQIGIIAAFVLTFVLLVFAKGVLPKDGGREFAVNGEKSKGKIRGCGLWFVLAFSVCSVLFLPFSADLVFYVLLIIAAMITGYLDDCSKAPWGEYKKGILDLMISVLVAVNYVYFNGSQVKLAVFGGSFELPKVLFVVLATILVWVSINVTNCTDGVDSLSSTLTMVTLFSFWAVWEAGGQDSVYRTMIWIFVACLLAYLWFNSDPSTMLMGDAGSRAMGVLIAVIALESGMVLLYVPFAIVMILDGGLGLLKVSLLRFLKIKILKDVRTPLHDHTRKNKGWSGPQTVFRFAIIQAFVSLVVYCLILIG